ncbi:hypothetical protein HDV00_008483 [Rhizophlyctis rosea]|nr:hypothetical protein HDV00_008483 [Rhizophlyctis rosea]
MATPTAKKLLKGSKQNLAEGSTQNLSKVASQATLRKNSKTGGSRAELTPTKSRSHVGSASSRRASLNLLSDPPPLPVADELKAPEPEVENVPPVEIGPGPSEEEEYKKNIEKLPLPFETLKHGLSELGRSPDGLKMVYLRLALPNANITNIDAVENYKYIQTLDLSGNNLTDSISSPLSQLRHLVYIDLSNNRLTTTPTFNPAPYNLHEMDLSRNQIANIGDLADLRFLKKCCLDRNFIRKITGLAQCRCLTHLSMRNNSITQIEGLDGLPIKFLDLRYNHIRTLTGLQNLIDITDLLLSHNAITSLEPLQHQNHPNLHTLDLSYNSLSDSTEIELLKSIPFLRNLNLSSNPLVSPSSSSDNSNQNTTSYDHRLSTVFTLPHLTILDAAPVTPEEKVSALNTFAPPASVVASVQHAAMLRRGVRRWATIRTKTNEEGDAERFRPVVLCGSSGAGKSTLSHLLTTQHPHIFAVAISHTTRSPREGERNGVDYHFVSRQTFTHMVEAGDFVEVVSLFGELYGVSFEELEAIERKGRVAVLECEVEGVLALKRSHLRPRYIFITVPDMSTLQERLEHRYGYSNAHLPSTDTHPSPQPDPSFSRSQSQVESIMTSSEQFITPGTSRLGSARPSAEDEGVSRPVSGRSGGIAEEEVEGEDGGGAGPHPVPHPVITGYETPAKPLPPHPVAQAYAQAYLSSPELMRRSTISRGTDKVEEEEEPAEEDADGIREEKDEGEKVEEEKAGVVADNKEGEREVKAEEEKHKEEEHNPPPRLVSESGLLDSTPSAEKEFSKKAHPLRKIHHKNHPITAIHNWLARAQLTKDYISDPGFFEATIVNDDLGRAFGELEGYLVGVVGRKKEGEE